MAIARVVFGQTLVTPFVVARYPRHDLLLVFKFAVVHLIQKVDCCVAAQSCSRLTIVTDFDLAIFFAAKCKPKISRHNALHLVQCEGKVVNEVLPTFQTDRQPQQSAVDASFQLDFFRKTLVCGCGRMRDD